MFLVRFRIPFAVSFGAIVVCAGGCSTAWNMPFSRADSPRVGTATADAKVGNRTSQLNQVADSASPDMTAVLDKLEQVRQIDPAAEQKLRDELRRTPPKQWPLVAEQFRASLAYHEQLAAKAAAADTGDGTHALDPMVMQTGYDVLDDAEGKPPNVASAAAASRPSAPIGNLVDPRDAKSDGVASEAMAKATPYSTPSAPVPNAPSSAGVPAASADTDAASASAAPEGKHYDPAVVPAKLEASSDPSGATAEPSTGEVDDLDWQQLVQRAVEDLNGRVAASPATTAEVHQHASLRMLWLLAGDTEKALEPIPGISPIEQDYWSRQLFALATYLDHHSQPDDKRRAAASVTHLDDAVARLRELGSLSLRNLSFCKNVYGYGAIEPFANDEFSPGQQVSLYIEVENYHSESTEKGYRTLLGSTYEVLDEKGERVTGGEFPDVEDCCRSRRRDFHMQYGLSLPEKIEPGKYQLQIVVKDRQSEKIGNAVAPFTIRGSRLAVTPSAAGVSD